MIELDRLAIRCGEFRLDEVALRIEAGEYVVLMGPSGAGKTTLLEAICGVRPIAAGAVRLGGRDVSPLPPAERRVGYVPQDVALFTRMTVRENLAYGLRVRGLTREPIDRRVGEVADALGIAALLERRPESLSGGEARRVGIGRAIAFEPEVVLLDEPLAGLDDTTREDIYTALEAMRHATGAAVLHVTHERRDAERLADRVVRLEAGRLTEDRLLRVSGAESVLADKAG